MAKLYGVITNDSNKTRRTLTAQSLVQAKLFYGSAGNSIKAIDVSLYYDNSGNLKLKLDMDKGLNIEIKGFVKQA